MKSNASFAAFMEPTKQETNMADTMRRWSMAAIGRDKLKLETVAVPRPGPAEIRVKVSAASLNYRDKLVIETGMGLALPQPCRSSTLLRRR